MEEVKVFRRKRGQSEKRREALRFALNESIGDKKMLAELAQEPYDPDERTYSSEEIWAELKRSYVGRFRTKRLRKKHANLISK